MNAESVLLVNPPYSLGRHFGRLGRIAPIEVPMGLAYIAAYLEPRGVRVDVLDCQALQVSSEEVRRKVARLRPDIVGITCVTTNFYEACEIARAVKKASERTRVVLGGPHPTVMPEEALRHEEIDLVVRGEGEVTMHEVASGRNNREIEGLSFKEGGKIVHNLDRPLIEGLDCLPMPARHLLPMERYRPEPDFVVRSPTHVLITSRGCPYRCIFCAARLISGYKYRMNSVQRVLEEIDLLVTRYHARGLLFYDDNFTVNRERAEEICDRLVEKYSNEGLVWACSTRVDNVDKALLRKMRSAGCRIISYGIESGSERLLKLIRKGIALEQVKAAVRWTKEAGIECRGSLILGLPTESKEESLRTIQFAKELALDRAKFSLATPYPGTELYRQALESDSFEAKDWSRFSAMAGFSTYLPIYAPQGRSPTEMKDLQYKAMREFYLRPSCILNLVKNVRSWKDLERYFWSFMSLL